MTIPDRLPDYFCYFGEAPQAISASSEAYIFLSYATGSLENKECRNLEPEPNGHGLVVGGDPLKL